MTPVKQATIAAAEGAAMTSRPPHRRRLTGAAPVVLMVAVVLFGLLTSRADYLIEGATALTYAIAATGLGLALGLAAEFLLGQLALFAAGAYVTAVLTSTSGWSFWPASLVGIAAATLVGLLLSLVALRISKFYFALIGFFLVSLVPDIVQMFSKQTGGTAGLVITDNVRFFGTTLTERGMYLLAAAALAVTLLLVRNVRRAPVGTQMRRMRESTAAVASSGVSPWRVRVATYVLASALAGLGGAIYSHISGFLQPDNFDLATTTLLFAAVLVGGSTTLLGPTIGVLVLFVLPREILNVEGYSDLIYGAIMLVSVVAFRGGIEPAIAASWRNRPRWLRRDHWTSLATRVVVATTAQDTGNRDQEDLAAVLWSLREGIDTGRQLAITGAQKTYGALHALDMSAADSVRVEPGTVHLLLGPNGSGKTTLLNAVCGFAPLDRGEVLFGGRPVTRSAPAAIARSGLGRSFQSPNLPDDVTPVDLLIASLLQLRGIAGFHWLLADPAARRAYRAAHDQATTIVTSAGLGAAMAEPCASLTSGQRRIVDVLIALTSRSSVVLLDEPAAGLSQPEREKLGDTVRELTRRGMSFVVVEHDIELAMRVADEVSVLAEGRLLAHGTPQEVVDNPEVQALLIGTKE